MASLISTDKQRIVIGLGKTGYSVVAFFVRAGIPVIAMDTRENPPYAEQVRLNFPNVQLCLGRLEVDLLQAATEIIVSPGLSLKTPEIQTAISSGVRVIGDIQVFADHVKAPVIAITGSNAKSTVTSLVGELALAADKKVAVGGNIGTPALDLLNDDVELYVMELSSFQLETTPALKATVATVLNVSPDHLDRYDSYLEYHQAKHKIFKGCQSVVINKEDPLSAPMLADGVMATYFGLSQPDLNQFGLLEKDGVSWLAKFDQPLLPVSELKIKGTHNQSNALAALALGEAVNLPMEKMLLGLKSYSGLPHRCQWLRSVKGVDYYNDSKGTNVGATEAAVLGLGPDLKGGIVLMLGGDGKGAEFSELNAAIKKYVTTVIAYGRDQTLIQAAMDETIPLKRAETFEQACELAQQSAVEGDAVLLSPACASFDMFKNFEVRGEVFTQWVAQL